MSSVAANSSVPTDKDPTMLRGFAAAGEFGSRRSGGLQLLDNADFWRKLLVSIHGELAPREDGASEATAQPEAAEDKPACPTGRFPDAGSANPEGKSNALADPGGPVASLPSFTGDALFKKPHAPLHRTVVLPLKHANTASARVPRWANSEEASSIEDGGKSRAQAHIISNERNGAQDLRPAQMAACACWAPASIQVEETISTAKKANHPVVVRVVNVEHEIGKLPEKETLASDQLPGGPAREALSAVADPQQASTGRRAASADPAVELPEGKPPEDRSTLASRQEGIRPILRDCDSNFPALNATNKQKGANGADPGIGPQVMKVDRSLSGSISDRHRHGIIMRPGEQRSDPGTDVSQGAVRYVPSEHTDHVYASGAARAVSQPRDGSESGARQDFAEALESGVGSKTAQWITANAHRAEAGFRDPSFGWIHIRAELGPEGVLAAVVPPSHSAAQALETHIGALTAHLEQQRMNVHSLTLSLENNHVDSGTGQGAKQQGGDDARGKDRHRSFTDRVNETGSAVATLRPCGEDLLVPAINEATRGWMHISVTA